jgi:hypothetical protein
LNRCQHAGHRHSAETTPAASTVRRMRHPSDVVSVVSPLFSGETRPQSTHV